MNVLESKSEKGLCKGKSTGFTLIELLVVIAIIAVLSSLMMPAIKGAKSQAKSVTCKGNLKQMTAAALLFTADNDGWMTTPARKRATIKKAWYNELPKYLGPIPSPGDGSSSVWICPSLYLINDNDPYTYSQNNKLSTASFGLSGRLDWSPINMSMMMQPSKSGRDRRNAPNGYWPVRTSTIPYFMDGTHNHRGWTNNALEERYFPHNWTCNMSFLDGHVETTKRWEGIWGYRQPSGGLAAPTYISRISRTRGKHPF